MGNAFRLKAAMNEFYSIIVMGFMTVLTAIMIIQDFNLYRFTEFAIMATITVNSKSLFMVHVRELLGTSNGRKQ